MAENIMDATSGQLSYMYTQETSDMHIQVKHE